MNAKKFLRGRDVRSSVDEVSLPSGGVVLVRHIQREDMLRWGILPQPITAAIVALTEAKRLDSAEVARVMGQWVEQDVASFIDGVNRFVCAVCIIPPEEYVGGTMPIERVNPSRCYPLFSIGMPDPAIPDQMSVDDLDFEDRTAIVQAVTGAVQARFHAGDDKPADVVGSVPDVKGDGAATE